MPRSVDFLSFRLPRLPRLGSIRGMANNNIAEILERNGLGPDDVLIARLIAPRIDPVRQISSTGQPGQRLRVVLASVMVALDRGDTGRDDARAILAEVLR